MRRKVIPDHLAALHHKSNSLDLGDIGDRVSSNLSTFSQHIYYIIRLVYYNMR
jgi:hypothetical protein